MEGLLIEGQQKLSISSKLQSPHLAPHTHPQAYNSMLMCGSEERELFVAVKGNTAQSFAMRL